MYELSSEPNRVYTPSIPYIHKSSFHHLPESKRICVARALMIAGEHEFDLVRLAYDESYVCLLRYPTFDTEPYPALQRSIKVLLSSTQCVVTNYPQAKSYLRRKDVFVSPSYSKYKRFMKLSADADLLSLETLAQAQ